MNIEDILVQSRTDRKVYTADHLIAVLDGGAATPARTTMTASYLTDSFDPTIYYTSLATDGTVITARTTTGVELSPCGDYIFVEDVTGLADGEFVAVWDEGDETIFVLERIVVDT